MTTTVRVFPSPGDKLKVRVTVFDADGKETHEYLRRGDPEKSYHVSPGGPTEAVSVEEVDEAESEKPIPADA